MAAAAGAGASCWILLALAALPLAAHLAAAQPLTVTALPISDPGFPYHSCSDYGCGGAPYTLDLVETALAEMGMTRMCFRLSVKPGGCGAEPSGCCASLLQRLSRIELSVGGWRAWLGAGAAAASATTGIQLPAARAAHASAPNAASCRPAGLLPAPCS